MSREIKFRAWDAIAKKMWSPIIKPDGRLMASNQMGGYVTYDDPQDPLMQYTGLKDKNGKEIYESDLIKNERGRTAKIEFNKYFACFDAVFVSDNPACYNPSVDRSYGFQPNMWANHVEVIGNIYENNELLEEKEQ